MYNFVFSMASILFYFLGSLGIKLVHNYSFTLH